MSKQNDGGPAFPIWADDMPIEGSPGLSVRDYFAAKAMQAIVTKLPIIDQQNEYGVAVEDKVAYNHDIANSAYWIADAMLEEREK